MTELTIENILKAKAQLEQSDEYRYIIIHPQTNYLLKVICARDDYYQRARRKRILKRPHRYLVGKIRKCLLKLNAN